MPLLADIIVRAKDGHEMTAACLRSIEDNTDPSLYRLILVDDGSDPPLADMLPDQPGIIVRHREPLGAVSATNSGLGIALSRGDSEAVVVMDNDTEVPTGDTGWLERFVAELMEFDNTAVVGATSHRVSQAQGILAAPLTYKCAWANGTNVNPMARAFVSFACCLRKDALREVGFWDTRYDPGLYEDTDYGMALRTGGWALRVARSVYIHHRAHATFQEKVQGLMARNARKYAEKWGPGRLWDDGQMGPEQLAPLLKQQIEARQGNGKARPQPVKVEVPSANG